ncbi:hypothetical protein BT69DRAFT_679669 [Atractiella rhizophila]|nr:hypothetical protein BT69DRAFT_679669 [Atractiella rhizophila]
MERTDKGNKELRDMSYYKSNQQEKADKSQKLSAPQSQLAPQNGARPNNVTFNQLCKPEQEIKERERNCSILLRALVLLYLGRKDVCLFCETTVLSLFPLPRAYKSSDLYPQEPNIGEWLGYVLYRTGLPTTTNHAWHSPPATAIEAI